MIAQHPSALGQQPHRLRLAAPVAEKLERLHLAKGKHVEAISLLGGQGYCSADGRITVTVARPDDVVAFEPDDYLDQAYAAAKVSREARGRAYHASLQLGHNASVDAHDHHMANRAHHSAKDLADDAATQRYFSTTMTHFAPLGPDGQPQPVFAASLVLAHEEWAARVVHGPWAGVHGAPMRIDIVGHRLCVRSAPIKQRRSAAHLRQAILLGPGTQEKLAQLHVLVIGSGGTGSVVAEQLARLGVGHITLVDMDHIETSNLNRLQGMGPSDVGRAKADALAAHLARCCPYTRVRPLKVPAWHGDAVAAAEQADAVVGCVDNNETRWFIDRLCTQYMLPYFDLGVRAHAATGEFFARSNLLLPGSGPCGHCSPLRFFPSRRPNAFLDTATLASQREAGYATDTEPGSTDPSLYALNQQAAGLFGLEFARWVSGMGPVAHSQLLFNHADGRAEIQRLGFDAVASAQAPDCPVCGSLLGACRSRALPRPEPVAPQLDPLAFATL